MASVYHILFLFTSLFLPSYTVAQTFRNLSSGDSFIAKRDTAPWVSSPSGEFAFGFYRLPDSELFLLAIWFDKIPEKTVVWSANRTNPVGRDSRVELTSDRSLVLYDHRQREVWRPAQTTGIATSGAMLDEGNFVLRGADSQHVWESFQEPTDTILPTQKLGVGKQLQSRLSDTDYSVGRFLLRLSFDGNLVLNSVSPNSNFQYDPYYSISTSGSGYDQEVIFDQSGYIYIQLGMGRTFNLTGPGNLVSPEDFYHRAILEFDGVFRQYLYPKDNPSSGAWKPAWSVRWSLPSDICNVNPAERGSGICGFNSFCELDEHQRPVCQCPPGYSYLNQENKFDGCKQDFDPPSCELDRLDPEKQFTLEEMANTGWDSTNYEELSPINEDECREQCMNDCNCAVAIIRDGTCWKKKIPLSHGQRNPQVRGKALIKVAKGNWSFYPSQVTQGKKRDRSSMILIGSLLLGSSVFLNFIFLLAISVAAFPLYSRRKQRHQQELGTLGMNLRSFTYRELEQVTEGFKITLGRGAFGIVYKGVLVASNSRDFIAVKKLNEVEKDNEEEFRTEVMAIGQTHHRNLVHLIGFCDEGPHRLLVYELMSNGSLASFIFGSSKPDWNQRKQIVLGIARGLLYLHEECNTQIIHCDIKPQNILLDDCYTARISDFGLAKLLKADQTRTMTNIRGTKGYVAPEWFRKTAITAKVDVYSFGVMLLEIICCRRNIKLEPENRGVAILIDWAWDCYKERRLDLLMEGGQDALSDIKRLERFVMVAFWCVQDDPSQRPTMKTVTQMLEGTIDVSVPPDPFSSSSLG